MGTTTGALVAGDGWYEAPVGAAVLAGFFGQDPEVPMTDHERAVVESLRSLERQGIQVPMAVGPETMFMLVCATQLCTRPWSPYSDSHRAMLTAFGRALQETFAGSPAYDLLERGWATETPVAPPEPQRGRTDTQVPVTIHGHITVVSEEEAFEALITAVAQSSDDPEDDSDGPIA